jgi:hypothetical protein
MLGVPTGRTDVIKFALDLVEKCQSSIGVRQSFYKTINTVCESGRGDGKQSLINLLFNHLDRLAANLFSPTELHFVIDFANRYPKETLDRAKIAANLLTHVWQYDSIDMLFASGVQEALKYGTCILKQWVQPWDEEGSPFYYSRLVMPWSFGVYNEAENGLSAQSALCETTVLTMPQAWQRISQMPIPQTDRERIFRRVASSAKAGTSPDFNQNFFRQVFSTSPLNTNAATGAPGKATPGGVVWFGNAAMGSLAPSLAIDVCLMHEIWVQDVDDWTTIQLIEPDILLTPREGKIKENLLVDGVKSGLQPYSLIQPNITPGYFWGRSELTDLIPVQAMLSEMADDLMRMFGVQVDKLIGFAGYDGLTDEAYDRARVAGYFNMPPNASATDLTPKFPPEAIPLIKLIIEVFNTIGGTPEIMQGKGEAGVRAGVHASTLLKTASPRQRQCSLIAERQCAGAAELTFSLMQAKDDRKYWTKAEKPTDTEETEFILSDLPDDRRVSVDSHSSSPIFSDDHQQLAAFGLKSGFVTKHGVIDMLNLPDKELRHAELREEEEKQARMMQAMAQKDPELFEKMMLKRGGGRR